MKNNKLSSIIAFLLTLSVTGIVGQNIHYSLSSSTGKAVGSNGNSTYTVGQLVYTTISGNNMTIAQGIQQQFEISEVTSLKGNKGITLSVSVYPNPSSDYLILNIEKNPDTSIESLSYQLYDVNSKMIANKEIKDYITRINMNGLVPSTYFVHISQTDKTQANSNRRELKSFKIIKK